MSSDHMSAGEVIKNLFYIPAFLLGLSPESYFILSVFMLADLILGVTRSAMLHGLQSIKSYKLTAGVISKLVVLIVPLIVVWAGRGSGIDLTFLGQWAIGVLVLSQAYSMLGHINTMRVGEERTEWDAVSFLLKKIRSMLENILVDSHNDKKL